MKEDDNRRLTTAQKHFKYDFDKGVSKTPVLKTNEELLVDVPPLAVSTNSLIMTDQVDMQQVDAEDRRTKSHY